MRTRSLVSDILLYIETVIHRLRNRMAVTHRGQSPCVAESPCVTESQVPLKWRGYDVQSIIDARYRDKLPCAADSNRHTESLKLATDLLLMLDGDKQAVQRIVESQSWVKEIIDERDENVAQTVQSAAEYVAQKEKKYASSLPSKAMLTAIQTATGKTFPEITKAQTQTAMTLRSATSGDACTEGLKKDDDMARHYFGAMAEAYFDNKLKDASVNVQRKTGNIML